MKLKGLRVLTDEEIGEIDRTARTILGEIGVVVNHPEAIERLQSAGAGIAGNRVRLTSDLVSNALCQKSEHVVLYDQRGQGIRLGADRHFHFSGAYNLNVLDYGAEAPRPARLEDVVRFTRLADALPEIDGIVPHVLALDQPESLRESATYRATLEHTTKHCLAAPMTFEGAKAWVELGRSVSADSDRPAVSVLISDAPLLQWDPESLQTGMSAVREGLPLFVLPGPVGGMSAPMTLAGCLAIKVAQCLFAVVLAQSIRPGAPVVYAGVGYSFLDMRSGEIAMAGPEDFLMTVAGGQMAAFYGLPSYSCSFLSNAKRSDLQTGVEKFGGLFAAVGSGVSCTINAGMIDRGIVGSLEQMVLDHEMLIMAHRMAAGITVNEDTLALEVIRELGPGGNFLTTDHTLRHLRTGENVYLTVFDRSSAKAEYYPLWERAHAEVQRILAD